MSSTGENGRDQEGREDKMVDEIMDIAPDEEEGVKCLVKPLPECVYKVERILKERINKRTGEMEFYVKWEGYDESENTWIEANNIDCKEKVGEYVMEHFHEYIDGVVCNDEPDDKMTPGDNDDNEKIPKASWVPLSHLHSDEEIKALLAKPRPYPFVCEKILGPVSRDDDGAIIYLVDIEMEDEDGVLRSSDLEERCPEMFLNFLERHLGIIDHCKKQTEAKEEAKKRISEGKEFIAEKIVDKKVTKAGNIVYQIKWLGCADKKNTWKRAKDLKCYDLICEFEKGECIGIQRQWKIHQIMDMKKTNDDQVYFDVEWVDKHDRVHPFTTMVLYELAKQHYFKDVLHYLAANVHLE